MTVEYLIKRLQDFPKDAIVTDDNYQSLTHILLENDTDYGPEVVLIFDE